MAKKPAVDPDALVIQALLAVATADRPPRLAGRGDTPALFPGRTGANRTAIDALTAPGAELVSVSGRGADEAVRLTRAGFERIAGQVPEDRIGTAAKGVAAGLPTATARAEFLNDVVGRTPAAAAELLPEYEAAVAAAKAVEEARLADAARKRERDERNRQALVRWLELTGERKQHRISLLLAELRAEGWTESARGHERVEERRPPREERRPPLTPQTAEDGEFRRDTAERLVSSWRDAVEMQKDEGRRFLETAMDNLVGLKRVGEEGDEVPFDGTFHEDVPGLPTGSTVRVVRSGWALEENADYDYVIQKAQVVKA